MISAVTERDSGLRKSYTVSIPFILPADILMADATARRSPGVWTRPTFSVRIPNSGDVRCGRQV